MSRVIVVGVDGSAGAGAALAAAIELTSALGDELVVVHAAEPPFRSVGEEWRESERALEELGSGLVETAPGAGSPGRRDRRCDARGDAPGRGAAARSQRSTTHG